MTLVDGLRGVAALMVLAFHFDMAARLHQEPAAWMPDALQWVFEHGWLGVQLFFVVSGFVIAYSLRGQRVTPGFLGRFVLRRALRLDPPYWVALGLEVLLVGWIGVSWDGQPESVTAGQLAAHMVYLQGFLGQPQLVGVFWTLCVEVQLYVAFILLLWAGQRLTCSSGAPSGSLLATAAVPTMSPWSLSPSPCYRTQPGTRMTPSPSSSPTSRASTRLPWGESCQAYFPSTIFR